ncbi:hypothetical protein [Actinomadura sp. 3N508]|uniref:hypothetical protein n=1 Tax=Actinomadura sp. 3N508 TaxID=3375153 RepID=UPI0037925AF0
MIRFDLAQHPKAVEAAMTVITQAADLGVTWKRRTLPAAALFAAQEVHKAALERGWTRMEADMVAAFVLQVGAEDLADAVRERVITAEHARAAIPSTIR